MGGKSNHPIPNSFPQADENQDVNYTFYTLGVDESVPQPEGAWSHGTSFDGRSEFKMERMKPRGEKPNLGSAPHKAPTQQSQQTAGHVVSALKSASATIDNAIS
jgi:Mn-containing catalase